MALQPLARWEAVEGVRIGPEFAQQTVTVYGNTNPMGIRLRGGAGGEMFYLATCPFNVTSCEVTLHIYDQPNGNYTLTVRAWSFAHDEALNVAAHQTYTYSVGGLLGGPQLQDLSQEKALTANEGELLVLGLLDANGDGDETLVHAISIRGE